MKIEDWKLYERLVAFALLGFFALFYLGHFVAFIIIGPFTVDEPNKVILSVEIITCVFVIGVAVHCFIGDYRQKKPKNSKGGTSS